MEKEFNKVLENSMEKKEKRIVALEEKIKLFENKFSEVKNLETKLNDLEISLQKQSKENKTLTEKVIKVQAILKKNEKKLFKCDQCDFTSVSEQGLKTHNKRKHTKAKFEEGTDSYPKRCDLCEKLFESEIDMKNI